MHYALPALLTPFAHIRNVDERTVDHGLHGFTLTSGTAMHTGGDLQGPVENGARQTAFRQRH